MSHFHIEWSTHTVTCPQGQPSRSWRERPERAGQLQVAFAKAVCQACPVRSACPKGDHRELQLLTQAQLEALQRQRAVQQTPEFRQA